MAVKKMKEFRALGVNELKELLTKVESELFAEKSAIASTKRPNNAGKYKDLRKAVARIKTFLSQKGVKV
ncbi:50S ribosomal protein L29 [Candidatus Micrarchaeota archaeon]|nr:50S ribosomal protein L29 [Candidatus Micrarchaeota archaeon]